METHWLTKLLGWEEKENTTRACSLARLTRSGCTRVQHVCEWSADRNLVHCLAMAMRYIRFSSFTFDSLVVAKNTSGFCLLSVLWRYLTLLHPKPVCTDDQESWSRQPFMFVILCGRMRIRFLGSDSCDNSRSSSRDVYHPIRVVLFTAAFNTIYVDQSSPTLSSKILILHRWLLPPYKYVPCIPIHPFIIFVVAYVLLLFMLFTTSSMFEFHVTVVGLIMIYIIELIMK